MSSGRFTVHGTTRRPSECASAMRLLGQIGIVRAPGRARPPPPRHAARSRRSPTDAGRPTMSARLPGCAELVSQDRSDVGSRAAQVAWSTPVERLHDDPARWRPAASATATTASAIAAPSTARPGCQGNVFSSMLKFAPRIDAQCIRQRRDRGAIVRLLVRIQRCIGDCPGECVRHRSRAGPLPAASGSLGQPGRSQVPSPVRVMSGLSRGSCVTTTTSIGCHRHVEFQCIDADCQCAGETRPAYSPETGRARRDGRADRSCASSSPRRSRLVQASRCRQCLRQWTA